VSSLVNAYRIQYVEPDENENEMDDIEDFEGIPNGECGYTDADDDLLDEQVARNKRDQR